MALTKVPLHRDRISAQSPHGNGQHTFQLKWKSGSAFYGAPYHPIPGNTCSFQASACPGTAPRAIRQHRGATNAREACNLACPRGSTAPRARREPIPCADGRYCPTGSATSSRQCSTDGPISVESMRDRRAGACNGARSLDPTPAASGARAFSLLHPRRRVPPRSEAPDGNGWGDARVTLRVHGEVVATGLRVDARAGETT